MDHTTEPSALPEEEISNLKGLSRAEAEERLREDGYNELASSRNHGILRIILGVLHEPMFILLVACGTLYLVLGDIQEAAMLLAFVFVIMGITVYQENRTEKALSALRDLSAPRALVIREGERERIPGREVVRDDIVIVNEGDRVPADALLLWSRNLMVDESLLTGESVPVRKSTQRSAGMQAVSPGGDDMPFIFAGTLAVQGQGIARISATGSRTEMGKIGTALSSIPEEPTILQKETGRLVHTIFAVAVVLCAVVIAGYGIIRNTWIDGILAGITLAMAMLPEEFPVVLIIFLALGAWKMSRKRVLARRIATVETLGAATVLCVDKTGTLTRNRMSIRILYAASCSSYLVIAGKTTEIPESFHELVEYGILAGKKDPFDPMEKALRELGMKTLISTEHLHDHWDLVEEYPLSREILALSHVWKSDDGSLAVASKGAPESIFDLCHLPEQRKAELSIVVENMAVEGLRVLGVARASFHKAALPPDQHDFRFTFLGLLGLADPVRDTVPAAVAECCRAGIRVVMITGDYPATARNIAKTIGFARTDRVVSGAELETMSRADLRRAVQETDIFARMVPEQKLLIVNALKDNGEVTAMTGDGVNDAPALKSAHIGVAMGERGTDVAREAAGLVLLSDDFTNIVDAVRMGRRIFDNLRKAMAYILSVHVPIAGLSLLPVLFGLPPILYPVHIVFLELIIDPACTIVFEAEAEEPDIMTRKPRNPKLPLFSGRMLALSVLQGISSLAVVCGVYFLALGIFGKNSEGMLEARTLAFVTLIVSNLCLILTNRSWEISMIASLGRKNTALLGVAGSAVGFLALVLYVPGLRRLFHFTYLHPSDLLITIVAGAGTVIWFEVIKAVMNGRGRKLA